jgi:hypothetical protein
MVEFFGGVNEIVVPDNTKSAVTSPHRYEPDVNKTYTDWAQHYGCAVIPTRSLKPRDKAKVENAVQGVERWVMAPLRHRKFFSLAELNQALRELVVAKGDGRYPKLLAALAKTDLLILDDWATALLTDPQRRDLFEITEDRYDTRAPSSPHKSPSNTGTKPSATRPSLTRS